MQGKVILKNADLFTVECGENLFQIKAAGKTKGSGIFVGDLVEFDEVITKVLPRKNKLIRPPLANVDKIFIVICPVPKPDYMLVDKLLILCHLSDIQPIIVLNKLDIADDEFVEDVETSYAKFYPIIKVSAKDGDTKAIEDMIEGNCVLAGQSAVGKSSIINSIFSHNLAEIGELSKRTERGKQTTRLVKLYKLEKGYLADTAGFSMLDLGMVSSIEKEELASYYPDFLKWRAKCKYRSCLHEHGECGVIEGVDKGKIPLRRYENYLKILDELKYIKRY